MLKHTFDCDRIFSSKKKKGITKQDCFLILSMVMMALLFLLFFHLFGEKGSYADVFFDGKKILEISLANPDEQYYLINISDTAEVEVLELAEEEWKKKSYILGSDYNLLVCQKGSIQMMQSSCPDKICVHHSSIERNGESIICLPHKLVVEITNGKEKELDGVAY